MATLFNKKHLLTAVTIHNTETLKMFSILPLATSLGLDMILPGSLTWMGIGNVASAVGKIIPHGVREVVTTVPTSTTRTVAIISAPLQFRTRGWSHCWTLAWMSTRGSILPRSWDEG